MASVRDSRSGAGGKIVTNRRRQRLAATPYDRPLPPPPPLPKSPNWFTGVIVPSARALASGAGKFITSAIFSDSGTSSSEDVDSASDDDVGVVYEYESPCGEVNALNEEKLTSSEMIQYGRESQFSVQRPETKRLIEQLIMQETFSREECDRLTRVLNSRVEHWPFEAGDKRSLVNSSGQTIDQGEDPTLLNKAVLEAKKWYQEKKAGLSSPTQLAHGTFNLNSAASDHMESAVGSPVDMARSYMRERPAWASPTDHIELKTPLTTTMKLLKEKRPYSVTKDVLSSSMSRNSLASGSWNIQEELRKVRSKAIEDMLHSPPSKNDSSLFGITATSASEEFTEAVKTASGVREEIFKPHSFWRTNPVDALTDVGVNPDPALSALGSRQDCNKASEAPPSNPNASSGNIEEPQTIQSDGVRAQSTLSHPTNPNHAEQQHSADPLPSKISGPPGTGAAELSARPYANGSSQAQASLSHDSDGKHNNSASNENRPTNATNVDDNHKLLSEAAYTEGWIVTETNSINSSSQMSVDVQNEESHLGTTQPSAEGKPDLATGKQEGRKVGRTRRARKGK